MKKVISMNLINVIQMKTQSFWLTALLVLLGVFSTVNTNAAEKLMAGTGKVNITPPNPSYPVHDSLYARTLILEAGASRIAFVSLDLVMYSNVPLAEKLKKQFGLQEVYFCPQHTHSGEAGPKEWLDAQITKALKQASSSMFEARISAGYRSFPQLSFNRLLLREDGRARESWVGDDHYRAVNPERIPHGPVDNSVGVIKLEDTKGNPKVILMNYACHPDVAWNNFEISADYVGYATKWTADDNRGAGDDAETDPPTVSFWNNTYKRIRKANLFMENLYRATGDEADKARMMAEAKFLRAFFYSELIRRFGGVIILDHSVDPNDYSSLTNQPRETFENSVEWVCNELAEAAKGLPAVCSSADVGRATDAACYAAIARLRLTAASPRKLR